MRIDLYEVTEAALGSQEKLPDLFMCIGDKDFLYERVTRYHRNVPAQMARLPFPL